MANIADSAGIFVGGVLDAFNAMEAVVARDGDVAFAQQEMLQAMGRVLGASGVAGGQGLMTAAAKWTRRK